MYTKPKHYTMATHKKEMEFILGITEDDFTKSFVIENFGEFNGKQKYRPYDYITIPKGSYGSKENKNKNEFTTTVGIYLFNKYFIETDLFDTLGFINKEIHGGIIKGINKDLSYALMEDDITIENLKNYSMKMQHFMRYVSVFAANYTDKMLRVNEFLAAKKKKLIKDNEEAIKDGDEIVSAKIETELLALARDYLKDDPSMEIYDSNSRGVWDNNFKTMFVMKGAIMNPDPTKGFNIATSDYINGISKKEYAMFANSIPGNAYARAKNTEVGGYWVKLFMFAYQHVVLDDPGSDCGTSKYINVLLTNDNVSEYMYNYIISGSKLIELTSKNRSEFIGKTVKFRFSSLCESKTGICNKCMGNLYYKLGIKNVGMTSSKPPSRIMGWSLSKMHDSSIKIHDMDVSKAFNI